jgi:hypothetical protein
MANFWLTKKMVLEALKMSEGMSQDTFINFYGSSEVKDGKEFTCMEIQVNGKKKTFKAEFKKLLLRNEKAVLGK